MGSDQPRCDDGCVANILLQTTIATTPDDWDVSRFSLLADELTSRALTARGMVPAARRRLMRKHRARVVGFGVATQLCFIVPLGAVATMPSAVAGATLLARSLLDAPAPRHPPTPEPVAPRPPAR